MIPKTLIDFDSSTMPSVDTDVIVIGSGIAGMYTAIQSSQHQRVIMISKKTLHDSNTFYAQGGIAAVMSDEDSPVFHRQDTLIAGAGLCDHEAVEVLVNEGPDGVRELIRLGTEFDRENGEYALTQEGAHSQRRILHANGDATGAEIIRALSEQVRRNPNIDIWDEHFAVDLLTEDGECYGVIVQNADGQRLLVTGKATILCAGGIGQLYRYTTNPVIATGDGIAMAYRAGAEVRDMEFVQFHPTVLFYPGAPRFLISEALRGEGAVLRNINGERFMDRYHHQLELAPRDVVANAIVAEMERTQSTFVYLDITHESDELVKHRFPTIFEFCLQYGLDLTTDWIPVAPATHYMMGGVKTDLHGESSIRRLFACGEVSSTGVHGANRLASNSLIEAIVFGTRIVASAAKLNKPNRLPVFRINLGRTEVNPQAVVERRLKLQKVMLRYTGLSRNAKGLEKGWSELIRQRTIFEASLTKREEIEFANMLTCALLITHAAMKREESRGAHHRDDFPKVDEIVWKKHTIMYRGTDEGSDFVDRLE